MLSGVALIAIAAIAAITITRVRARPIPGPSTDDALDANKVGTRLSTSHSTSEV